MAMALGQFERVAQAITERTAELLGARTTVVDERLVVVASTEPEAVGLPLEPALREPGPSTLRVPLHVGDESGEVIVADTLNGEVFSPRLAQALVELIINQTAILARLPNQHELKNKFIHDLLHGDGGNEATILREAQLLGMDLTTPRAVILIDASAYIMSPAGSRRLETVEARIQRRAQLVIASVVSFFRLPSDTICAYIGDGEVAVLKASTTQDLASWADRAESPEPPGRSWADITALKSASEALLARLRRDTNAAISIGVGRHHPGIPGLARSYEDARAALSLGCRFHGPNRVHCLDALGVASFVGVADETTKIDLAMHLLSPLDHEPELLDTLAVFFARDCCPSETAAELNVHRNTLSYRLNKVATLTGLSPYRFDDAVQIRLALLLRSLQDPRPVVQLHKG